MGGLLSAFELSGNKHPILVTKAKELADKLAFAWVGVSSSFNARDIICSLYSQTGLLSPG